MLKNYLKSALRIILKRRTISAINILGLAVGMAACLLILHYAAFELSYDKFHEDLENIYRFRGGDRADIAAAAGRVLTEEFPEVLDYVRLLRAGSWGVYSYQDKYFREEKTFSTSNALFRIFSFKLLQGNREKVLSEPNSVVLTESTAKKYFGDEDPMGKVLKYNGRTDYKVVGIMEDVPKNSHLEFDLLASIETLRLRYGGDIDNSWIIWGFYTYIKVAPGTDPVALERKVQEFSKRKQKEVNRPESFWEIYHVMPLKDIHLFSSYVSEASENGSGTAVKFLLVVAFLILVIAWSNYINLSTARSLERAKEVGVRKVVGANQRQLIRQFLFESLVLNVCSALLALIILELVLPIFSRFSRTPAVFYLVQDFRFWILLSGIFVLGIFLSGMYPALVLSSYQPVSVFKGITGTGSRGVILRKGLVVFQFMVSAALIAGTLTVYNQISHMIKSDLGMDIEQTLVLERPSVIIDKSREEFEARTLTFTNELEKISGVEQISRSTYVPGDDVFMINEGQKADEPIEATIDVYEIQMDENFIEMYDLELLAGRNFSKEFGTDGSGVILNDTARKLLGWESPESAINQKFIYQTKTPFTVIGIVADYHQESLKQNFEPLSFLYRPSNNGHYSIKIKTENPMGIIAAVKELWDKFFPGNPFEYFFLDDHYNRQYGSDWQFLRMFGLFSLLAIFVACLGLLGLSLFNTIHRTKEIGIRKVLGASFLSILFLLTKEFLKLILLANTVSLPLFYFYLNRWLEKYPFRIDIGWWFFAAPVVLIAAIAFCVISYHSLKAATSNPVKALRYE